MAGAATPAIRLLRAEGVEHQTHSYTHDKRTESYGDEAVRALVTRTGVRPEQVLKTLVLELAGQGLAVAVLPVPASLSLKSAAAAFGSVRAVLAEQRDAERSTGYVAGGISPLGQRRPLPTVLDTSTLGWDRVLCSAGRRGLEIELAPDDLARLTGATFADIRAG